MLSDWLSARQDMLRIGLIGRPGAGKSSSATILRECYQTLGTAVSKIRLAEPLYDMQEAFYRRLDGRVIEGQDGALLNFFGQHFRLLDPNSLIADFSERCVFAYLGGARVLLCDDVRPVDVPQLRELGFSILGINAPVDLCMMRKQTRGDVILGEGNHQTERGLDAVTLDYEIENTGSLEELRERISRFVESSGACDRFKVPVSPEAAARELCRVVAPVVEAKLHRFLAPRFREHRHQIASLIIAENGRQFFGLHVEATVGRASSCAENGALAQFCADGQKRAILIASYRLPRPGWTDRPRFVAPCGICRELLTDYVGDCDVLISVEGKVRMLKLHTLLPEKYVGTKWAAPATSTTGVTA